MTKLALLLSLLVLGAIGLVACGAGDDDETAAATTETTDSRITYDELAGDFADNKSCGAYGRYRLAVVEGDISCPEARRVMHGALYDSLPGAWFCGGSDAAMSCVSGGGDGAKTIRALVRKEI
jgi:hypothetical protein